MLRFQFELPALYFDQLAFERQVTQEADDFVA